jgi:hypothetical protein
MARAPCVAPEPVEHMATDGRSFRFEMVIEIVGWIMDHPEPLHHLA